MGGCAELAAGAVCVTESAVGAAVLADDAVAGALLLAGGVARGAAETVSGAGCAAGVGLA